MENSCFCLTQLTSKKKRKTLSEDAYLISKKVQLLKALKTVCKSSKWCCEGSCIWFSMHLCLSPGRWKTVRFFWHTDFTTYRNTNRIWEQRRKTFLAFFALLWKARIRALCLQTGAISWRGNELPHCYWILVGKNNHPIVWQRPNEVREKMSQEARKYTDKKEAVK